MKRELYPSEIAKEKQDDLDYMEEVTKFGRPLTGKEKRRFKRAKERSKK